MAHLTYEDSKAIVLKTILILAVVTVVEVLISLLGKGHLIDGFHMPRMLLGTIMIIFSFYKAYLIIYEFMHMKYEVPALIKTVLLPALLLIWVIIAFLMEGHYWNTSRAGVQNDVQVEMPVKE